MAYSSPTAAPPPSPSGAFAVHALTTADAGPAGAVIREAFAAQSHGTKPPSSALRETTESIAAKIAAGGGFGAFAGGLLVAAALWQVDGDALVIGRVCALPGFRGRALSGKLIAACESAARARGLRRLRLRVRLELPENERLFSRIGFVRVRIEAHPGFDAPTVAILEKPLP